MVGHGEAEKGHDGQCLAQLAALPAKTTAELKQLWRELYDREPRPFNRDFLIKTIFL